VDTDNVTFSVKKNYIFILQFYILHLKQNFASVVLAYKIVMIKHNFLNKFNF